VLVPIVSGVVVLALSSAGKRRAEQPMLPMRLFADRGFSAVNIASLLFSSGVGSIFLLAQFLQTVQGYSPLDAGLRTCRGPRCPDHRPDRRPPVDRIGGRPLLVTGLALQATGLLWIAATMSTTMSYAMLVRRSRSPASGWRCSSSPSRTW